LAPGVVIDGVEDTLAGVASGTGFTDPFDADGLIGVPLTDAGLLPALLFFLFFECRRIDVRSKCCRRNSAFSSLSPLSPSLLLLAMPVISIIIHSREGKRIKRNELTLNMPPDSQA
jgi:hypothetical protein